VFFLDTNIFYALGYYYPSRFPSVWARLDQLVEKEKLWSVKEVRREIENNCPFDHVEEWVKRHREIFRPPEQAELIFLSEIFRIAGNQRLVRRDSIMKGFPVADPFLIAACKIHNGILVTEESQTNEARIPSICRQFGIRSIGLERFLAEASIGDRLR
jgi:predicted nucleic acid-binding protein